MHRPALVTMLLLLPPFAHDALGQRRTNPETPAVQETGSISIHAKIGGKSYQASGAGRCRHAPDASIRDVSASLWMVEYGNQREAGLKQLTLTLWRPKDESPDQLSLNVETGSGSHRIQTGQEGESGGQGTVTILPSGPGGRLEITGKDARGKALQVTIDCPTFASIEAEGG
jgi:hypothetical protein